MKESSKKILDFVVVVFLIYMSLAVSVYTHEMGHKTINSNFGLNSTMKFEFPYMEGSVTAENVTTSEEFQIAVATQQSWQEIIGYNLNIVFLFALTIMTFWKLLS